jgi:hypothetical protein
MRSKEEIEEALKVQSSNAAEELRRVNETTGSVKDMHTRRHNVHREKVRILEWVLEETNTKKDCQV